jgi:hypothetical protein
MTMRYDWAVGIPALLLLSLGLVSGAAYYASPTGGGNGLGVQQPMRIADFWAKARPGDTLLLLDGTYTGADAMIAPPRGLHGTEPAPITVRARHDGKVTLDGEGESVPVTLQGNDWFVLEGFNACRSSRTVVSLTRSSHCVVRRVCAWDAADNNTEIFGTHTQALHNLFEDCAAWGVARKTYQNSQGGDYTTYRRCFGIWEGCHAVGPKMVFSMYYNSQGIVAENCIATWDGKHMRESHTVLGYLKSQRVVPVSGLFSLSLRENQVTDASLTDCAAFVEEGAAPVRPFRVVNGKAANLTAVGGDEPQFEGIQVEHVLRATGAAGQAAWAAMFRKEQPAQGAHLYYRYENGKLTDQPLWPWPMNERIKELIGVDVTATVMGMGRP